ncbi:MAG: NTP/NDP exchange transporter [Lautropia sp.]
MNGLRDRVRRLLGLEADELLPALVAALFFFAVLTALGAVRPAREALGVQRGIDSVRWLFVGTALVTLVVSPIFGWLVSRFRRMAFIAFTYLFFAASLCVFYALLRFAPQSIGQTSGQVFYVWFSVFNLFATMVFWALMADRFTLEQSKRLFPPIAAGGTVGAIAGPSLAALLAGPLGTSGLLLVGAAFLLLAIVAALGMSRGAARADAAPIEGAAPSVVAVGDAGTVIGGSAWAGLKSVACSRYLLGIAAYMVLLAVISTFLYFTRLQMVAALGPGTDMRAAVFARVDVITQTATLVLQLLVAGRVMKRIGVSMTLALLPATVMLGFVGLAIVGSLAALVAFEATFRAVQRAIMRPARETLFTVVAREDKYKAKAVIDTFGYRAGDVVGAWVEGLVKLLGPGLVALATVAVPLAVGWGALGLWLGARQRAIAAGVGNPANAGHHVPIDPIGGEAGR